MLFNINCFLSNIYNYKYLSFFSKFYIILCFFFKVSSNTLPKIIFQSLKNNILIKNNYNLQINQSNYFFKHFLNIRENL